MVACAVGVCWFFVMMILVVRFQITLSPYSCDFLDMIISPVVLLTGNLEGLWGPTLVLTILLGMLPVPLGFICSFGGAVLEISPFLLYLFRTSLRLRLVSVEDVDLLVEDVDLVT